MPPKPGPVGPQGCALCRNIRVVLAAGLTGCAGWYALLLGQAQLPVPVWLWGALALGAGLTLWTGWLAGRGGRRDVRVRQAGGGQGTDGA
jgi:hypothetical protein